MAGAIIKDLGEWDFVVTMPLEMWTHILGEQMEGINNAEAAGR